MNPPYEYQYINAYNARMNPNPIHVKNAYIARYFKRYLLQRALSVFKWSMPDNWAEDYVLYVLYTCGYIAIINTNKFGVIPQNCGLKGYDIFYRPTHATISNPLLHGILEPRIGVQCELLRLQPDYGGIMDIIDYYGNMLALCSETVSVNIFNSKLSYVFNAASKTYAESFKKMFDKISNGEPAVVVDNNLFKIDGKPNWEPFQQNVSQNYIAGDLLSDMRQIEAMFDTEIGIPNANTDKRANMIESEVESNNIEVASKCELWLDQLKKSIEKINKMFNLSLSVDWRFKPEVQVENDKDSNQQGGVI